MTTTPGEGDPLAALSTEFDIDDMRRISLELIADATGGHAGHDTIAVLFSLIESAGELPED